MNKDVLWRIGSARAQIDLYILNQPRIFYMVAAVSEGPRARPLCTKKVILNIKLHLEHGTVLKLRNGNWLSIMQRVTKSLLKRLILEALRLNTRELVASTTDLFAGSVDAVIIIEIFVAQGDGRLACITKNIFHANGSELVKKGSESTDDWCDIGSHSEER